MKNLIIIILFLFGVNASAQDNVSGIWKTDKDNTLVRIEKQGDSFIGKVISSDDKDVKPGTIIIKEGKQEKGIIKGQLYLFKKSRWFQATFEAQGNKLKVTGKWTFITHTVHWTKA